MRFKSCSVAKEGIFEKCFDDIKNHYESLGFSVGIIDRTHLCGKDSNGKFIEVIKKELEISWYLQNKENDLSSIKEDIKKELRNRFVEFDDVDVENLTKEDLMAFYKYPSLKWKTVWNELRKETI